MTDRVEEWMRYRYRRSDPGEETEDGETSGTGGVVGGRCWCGRLLVTTTHGPRRGPRAVWGPLFCLWTGAP